MNHSQAVILVVWTTSVVKLFEVAIVADEGGDGYAKPVTFSIQQAETCEGEAHTETLQVELF